MSYKPPKLTERQRTVLAATIRAWRSEARWYRAQSSGERVTLASLYRNGFLDRQAWRGVEGEADSAYEYRPRSELMPSSKRCSPRARDG